MTDEDFYAKHDEILQASEKQALAATNSSKRPEVHALKPGAFDGLAPRTVRLAERLLSELRAQYGELVPSLILLSIRAATYGINAGAKYVAGMIAAGAINDSAYTQQLATPDGYADIEGVANTLYNDLAKSDRPWFEPSTAFGSVPPDGHLLKAAAVHWFTEAALEMRQSRTEAAGQWLHEAYDALILEHGGFMWMGANEEAQTQSGSLPDSAIALARTAIAKSAAFARHAESRAMKAEAFDWFDRNHPAFSSLDSMAEAMTRQQPIKFRTARDWAADWRRLRSAGRP